MVMSHESGNDLKVSGRDVCFKLSFKSRERKIRTQDSLQERLFSEHIPPEDAS